MKEGQGIRYLMVNGKLLEAEEAKIHISTPAVKYGANVFEGIRAYWNEEKEELYIFRLDDHLTRIQESSALMRLKVSDDIVPNLRRSIIELLIANELRQDVHIRPMIYVDGDGPVESLGPIGTAVNFSLIERWFGPKRGVHCSVSSWVRISDNTLPPRIKCAANYQNSRLALVQAKLDGYDSTIILNDKGKVSEGPGYAFFMIRNGLPVTPLITNNILESITRSTVIHLFKEFLQLETVEREIDRTETYIAEEAFFCGTGAEITPILSIDKFILSGGATGPITEAIQKTYYRIVRGEVPDHEEWRTPVYGASESKISKRRQRR